MAKTSEKMQRKARVDALISAVRDAREKEARAEENLKAYCKELAQLKEKYAQEIFAATTATENKKVQEETLRQAISELFETETGYFSGKKFKGCHGLSVREVQKTIVTDTAKAFAWALENKERHFCLSLDTKTLAEAYSEKGLPFLITSTVITGVLAKDL